MTNSGKKISNTIQWLSGGAAIASGFLAMDSLRLFSESPLLGNIITVQNHYYYALLGLLLPLCFLIYPTTSDSRSIWLDSVLSFLTFAACSFFFLNAEKMLDYGWEFSAPSNAIWASFMLWALILEALRRSGGMVLFSLVLLFSLYPIFADKLPGSISGMASSPAETASYHIMSIESILGLPFRAFAELVIGFLIFGIALQHTGGGKFFIDLALAMFGHVRGGSAKVAIVSSGLMGSMSGSVITNVLTTGQMTIPAMQKNGFEKEYAAGVEACASTGGVLLPPIMGSTAFVMATFLNVSYTNVALAAAVPAFLYFFSIYSGRRIRSSQRFKRDTEKHFAKHEENFAARMVLYCRVHNPDLFTHFSAKRSDRTFYCDGNVAVSKSSLSKTSMGLIKSR